MFKLIAVADPVTKRDFLEQLQYIGHCCQVPNALILRRKDLSLASYELLLQALPPLPYTIIPHTHYLLARDYGYKAIHVPLTILQSNAMQMQVQHFTTISTSVHSIEEAKVAAALGATHLIAGHVFATTCKEGVPPRGVDWLQQVCTATALPVYAIGGFALTEPRQKQAQKAGAQGVCVRSAYMML